MKLGNKQELFAVCLAHLITEAGVLGYAVRLRELQRTERQALWNATHCSVKLPDGRGRCERIVDHASHFHADPFFHKFKPIGIKNSLHRESLAIDLYLSQKSTRRMVWSRHHYELLGDYWESLHELCVWGGRFGDLGHFAVKHRGMK